MHPALGGTAVSETNVSSDGRSRGDCDPDHLKWGCASKRSRTTWVSFPRCTISTKRLTASAPNRGFYYLPGGRVCIKAGYNHWSSDHRLHVASCCRKNDSLTLQRKAHLTWRESLSNTQAKCIQVPKVKVVIMHNGPIRAAVCNSKSNLFFPAQPPPARPLRYQAF